MQHQDRRNQEKQLNRRPISSVRDDEGTGTRSATRIDRNGEPLERPGSNSSESHSDSSETEELDLPFHCTYI